MAQDDELDDDNTLEDNFLSGDLMPNDDDYILGGEGDPDVSDEDDEIIDDDEDPGSEDDDIEDEEDEEGTEAAGKADKAPVGDDADGSESFLRAAYWKETGKLPADLEIPKDIDDIQLEDLYLKQVEKNVVNRIQTEIKEAIQAKGIDPDEIFGGESEDEYYQKEYARIATIPYTTLVANNDDVSEALRILGTEYWTSKTSAQLSEEELSVLVEKDINKMDEEELYAKYQKYFGAQAKVLATKIQSDTKEKARQEDETNKANAKYIKEKLASKYTPAEAEKVIAALTKKDHMYDNGKGVRKPVTLFEKKRLEAESSIDGQLAMAVHMILGINEDAIKEKSERVGSMNILQKLAKASASSTGNTNGKQKGQNKITTKSREFEEMLLD